MYIINNKITTDLDISSSIELLNNVKNALFTTDDRLLNFDFSERVWTELSCLVLRLMIQ